MEYSLLCTAVREQNSNIIVGNSGECFPVTITNLGKMDCKTSIIYSLLTWDVKNIVYEDNFEPHVIEQLRLLSHYMVNKNLVGKIKYYFLRENILRYEIFESNAENVYQMEFHLSNGSFCLSINFVPIVQTCVNKN